MDALDSGPEGLSAGAAAARLAELGPNEIPRAAGPGRLGHLLAQVRNPLIPILIAAASLSAFLGQGVESIAILVIVLFSIGLGFMQESRAENALAALRRLAAPPALALRDGRMQQFPARDLVPGDVIEFKAGDRLPADARLLDAANLQLDEASLTGESQPVAKSIGPVAEVCAVGDRRSMVYAGTVVTYGRGRAVVTGTGLGSELGRVTGLLAAVRREPTPLQRNLGALARTLAILAALVAGLIAAAGILRGEEPLAMMLFAVALGVAVVPEALPAVVTIALAAGVQRMARERALVRHLPAVETLGSVSVICADKTGTLTRDEMVLRQVVLAGGGEIEVTGSGYDPQGEFLADGQPVAASGPLAEFLRGAALSSDARLAPQEQHWIAQGDPTEAALVAAAAKAGLDREGLAREFPRTGEIPFSSERKRMTTLHAAADGPVAFSKGAPEVILGGCNTLRTAEGEIALTDAERQQILMRAEGMASQGLRVIAVATRRGCDTAGDAETGQCLLGLAGIQDPPRPEAREAIRACQRAGIRVVMITGDHPETARAIATELGLLTGGRVVTGGELAQWSAAELAREVEGVQVYARVSPEDKLRIVDAWQALGHVVAMTGDGVNDAPALRKANVGIAMGRTGTDVSREAADMTLADDNFASIVSAVEEGRRIFANIQKFIKLLLSTNLGEVGLIAGATLAGVPLPLTAAQILYVNLATDGLPAIAMAVDPAETDLMDRPPRDPRAGVLDRPVMLMLIAAGAWTTVATLGLYLWHWTSGLGLAQAMTLTFACLILIEFFQAFCFRSGDAPVWRRPFANRWLNLAVCWELIALSALVYVPILQRGFGTQALGWPGWLAVVVAAFSIVPVIELVKRAGRH